MLGVLAVAGPFGGDAVAEDVGDMAVDHRHLPVGAVVDVAKLDELEGMVTDRLHPGLPHRLELVVLHFGRAEGVDGQAHLDPWRAFSARILAICSVIRPFHQT